jgi:hypothetical protein
MPPSRIHHETHRTDVHHPRRRDAGSWRRRRGHRGRRRPRRLAGAAGRRGDRRVIADRYRRASALLLGRRTYDIFASYWPEAPDETEPFRSLVNDRPKYVASRSESELTWADCRWIGPDAASTVSRAGRSSATCSDPGLVRPEGLRQPRRRSGVLLPGRPGQARQESAVRRRVKTRRPRRKARS